MRLNSKQRTFKKLVASVSIALLMSTVVADTETVGGYTWTYEISDGSATISKVSPAEGDLEIPSVLGGCPVTSIGYRAFYGCSGLTSVTIGSGVTSIGEYAFYGCSGLTSVTIPDSVTSIGRGAFYTCSNLASVTIPDSVTSFGYGAFFQCSDALYDMTTISGIALVDGWVVYCMGALSGDLDLTSVRGIADKAFSGCSGLTSVTIGNGVTSIGDSAFYGCSGLTSVTIGSGVTSIGPGAFYGCSGLTAVYITDLAKWCGISFVSPLEESPYSAHTIKLYLNGSLIEGDVTIPDGVTSIGPGAFYGCSGLTSVTIPDGVTSIGSCAFYGCSGLTSVTIPDGVTSIWAWAFSGCRGLTSVTIPDSVTKIDGQHYPGDPNFDKAEYDSRAFAGCSGLTSVTIPSRYVMSEIFPDSYSIVTNIVVPQGSTSIVNDAFKGCVALSSIAIPDGVTSVGDEAFYNCASLSSLTIPGTVTHYGVNCFEGCPAYALSLYRMIFCGGANGGGSTVVHEVQVVTTVVENVEAPYALTNSPADRAIASVTVDGDCAIDEFVLRKGKVYDAVLRIVNTAVGSVRLSLPTGYVYEKFKGTDPLTIPPGSTNMLTITRTANRVFMVSREEMEAAQ